MPTLLEIFKDELKDVPNVLNQPNNNKEMKTKWEQKEQIQKLIHKINDRLVNLKLLKGGLMMTIKVFQLVLKEHPELNKEYDILWYRKECLKRLLWKLP